MGITNVARSIGTVIASGSATMKTIDLRPWAVTLLASVYSAVFWTFHSSIDQGGEAPRPVRYEELPPNSRLHVEPPAGWTIARAGDRAPIPRPVTTRTPRIRTRSS